MGIFPDTRGQLKPQSKVGSDRNCLNVVHLPGKNEEDPKMKALEISHYTLIFIRSRAANSIVGGGIWPKFKHIQAYAYPYYLQD